MTEVFVGSEAVAAAALTEHQLRSRNRPIFRGVYLPAWCDPTIDDYTVGAWLWSRKRAVVAGVAASALHGAQWVDAETPVELVAKSARPQPGLIVRNETLHAEEVTQVTCHSITLPVTTPARTAFDLGRHLPRGQALARLDALLRATPFSIEDVLMLAEEIPGCPWPETAQCCPPVNRWRRSITEGKLAASGFARRRIAEANHTDTRAPRMATCGPARHGLGGLLGRRRVRRRSTPGRPPPVRQGHQPDRGDGEAGLGGDSRRRRAPPA